jgi:hypothetical protein
LKLVNVPELKEMEMKSMIAYDGRRPLSAMAQEFLSLLRKKAGRNENDATSLSPRDGTARKIDKLEPVSAKTGRKYPSPHRRSVA